MRGEMHMRKRLLSFLPAALGLVLALGSLTVFSACDSMPDGSWMRCHSAQRAVAVSAALLAAVLVLQALARNKAVRIALNGVALAGCVLIFLLPGTLMPMCMLKTHRCHTLLKPFAQVMAAAIALPCLWNLFALLKKSSARKAGLR